MSINLLTLAGLWTFFDLLCVVFDGLFGRILVTGAHNAVQMVIWWVVVGVI